MEPFLESNGENVNGPTESGKAIEGFRGDDGLHVEEVEVDWARNARGQFEHKRAVAGTEFHDYARRFGKRVEGAREVAGVAHPGVDQAEVAPRMDGAWVVRREMIE